MPQIGWLEILAVVIIAILVLGPKEFPIALKSNEEIVSGLIFDPIKNEMFFAEKDNGAYFNNHRIKVSKKDKLDD